LVPFTLPSFFIAFIPLLAADSYYQAAVDDRWLHADLRASGAHDRHRLGSWSALNVRAMLRIQMTGFPPWSCWTCATLRAGNRPTNPPGRLLVRR
jgi:hypothetical protein